MEIITLVITIILGISIILFLLGSYFFHKKQTKITENEKEQKNPKEQENQENKIVNEIKEEPLENITDEKNENKNEKENEKENLKTVSKEQMKSSFPFQKFQVSEAKKKPVPGDLSKFHWVYEIKSIETETNTLNVVYRRYSDFKWLTNFFETCPFGMISPPIPDKDIFLTIEKVYEVDNSNSLEIRKRSFLKFLNETGENDILNKTEAFQKFLTLKEEDFENYTQIETKPSETSNSTISSVLSFFSNSIDSLFREDEEYIKKLSTNNLQLKSSIESIITKKKKIIENLKCFIDVIDKFEITEFRFQENNHTTLVQIFKSKIEKYEQKVKEEIKKIETEIIENINYNQWKMNSFIQTLKNLTALKKSFDDSCEKLKQKKENGTRWSEIMAEEEKEKQEEILKEAAKIFEQEKKNFTLKIENSTKSIIEMFLEIEFTFQKKKSIKYDEKMKLYLQNVLTIDLGMNSLNLRDSFQPMKKNDLKDSHTVYNIKTSDIDIYRRYTDFELLYYGLIKSESSIGCIIPSLPSKEYYSTANVNQRARAFSKFIYCISEDSELSNLDIFKKFLYLDNEEEFNKFKEQINAPSYITKTISSITSYAKSFWEKDEFKEIGNDIMNSKYLYQTLKKNSESIFHSTKENIEKMKEILQFSRVITNDNLNEINLNFQDLNAKSTRFLDHFEICLLEWLDFYLQFCDDFSSAKVRLTDFKKENNNEIARLKSLKPDNYEDLMKNLKQNEEKITKEFIEKSEKIKKERILKIENLVEILLNLMNEENTL
eukprot:gene9152-1240_t